MDPIPQDDRTLVANLGLGLAEIALICAEFQIRELPSSGGIAWLGRDLLTYDDTRGARWQVDTHALANRLTIADPSVRGALSRAIRRFWQYYPQETPVVAMRSARFLN